MAWFKRRRGNGEEDDRREGTVVRGEEGETPHSSRSWDSPPQSQTSPQIPSSPVSLGSIQLAQTLTSLYGDSLTSHSSYFAHSPHSPHSPCAYPPQTLHSLHSPQSLHSAHSPHSVHSNSSPQTHPFAHLKHSPTLTGSPNTPHVDRNHALPPNRTQPNHFTDLIHTNRSLINRIRRERGRASTTGESLRLPQPTLQSLPTQPPTNLTYLLSSEGSNTITQVCGDRYRSKRDEVSDRMHVTFEKQFKPSGAHGLPRDDEVGGVDGGGGGGGGDGGGGPGGARQFFGMGAKASFTEDDFNERFNAKEDNGQVMPAAITRPFSMKESMDDREDNGQVMPAAITRPFSMQESMDDRVNDKGDVQAAPVRALTEESGSPRRLSVATDSKSEVVVRGTPRVRLASESSAHSPRSRGDSLTSLSRRSSHGTTNFSARTSLTSHHSIKVRRLSTRAAHENPLFYLLMTEKSIDRMHLDEFESFYEDFKMQRVKRCLCPFTSYYGGCGAIWILSFATVLMFIGLLPALLVHPSDGIRMYYTSLNTSIPFTINESISPPIYIYYAITQFYGNFRTYQTSKPEELWPTFSCTEFVNKDKLAFVRPNGTLPDAEMTSGDAIYPCRLGSMALFNDEFSIYKRVELPPGEPGFGQQRFDIDRTNVADWRTFVLYAKPIPEGQTPFISVYDQSFRVWLPSAFTPNFKKLYGVIHEVMPSGDYLLDLDTNLWPSTEWHATKSVMIETLGPLGRVNAYVSSVFAVIGVVLALIAGLIFTLYKWGVSCNGKSLALVSPDRLLHAHTHLPKTHHPHTTTTRQNVRVSKQPRGAQTDAPPNPSRPKRKETSNSHDSPGYSSDSVHSKHSPDSPPHSPSSLQHSAGHPHHHPVVRSDTDDSPGSKNQQPPTHRTDLQTLSTLYTPHTESHSTSTDTQGNSTDPRPTGGEADITQASPVSSPGSLKTVADDKFASRMESRVLR
eukprot:GHVN01064480.1.p1 GENE.GHVN01064480.1~~GHVN01064480.1.p1  ORF type:complete len:962 (+),score=221.75 GHVN01064480.1:309-3194(+)